MKKRSLAYRLTLLVVIFVLTLLLLISLSFNMLLTNYLENTAYELLSHARQSMEESRRSPPFVPRPSPGRAEMVTLLPDYSVVPPSSTGSRFGEQHTPFVEALKTQQKSLTTGKIERVQTPFGLYYYTAVAESFRDTRYVVFYLNMTHWHQFGKSVHGILWLILALALLATLGVTFFLAKGITGPIELLSQFATRMGRGHYEPLQEEFQDQELDSLKTVMNNTAITLKAYDEEQRRFFQNVSHELRTPLQIIKCNAEGMKHQILDPSHAASVIQRETDALCELVEDMLYLSRLESKSQDMFYKEQDLRETLSYTVERYDALYRERGIQVQFDFSDQPVLFTYDERSLEQALQNLLSNAIRHTKDRICVSCKKTQGRILLRISDNGCGIPEEEVPKVFDRFYKGEAGVHGIGLSIVKAVVNHYGGRVEVRSRPFGTEFSIFFPIE